MKASAVGIDPAIVGPHRTLDDQWHIYGVDRFESEIVYRHDNEVASVTSLGVSFTTALQLRLRSSPTTGPDLRFDWLRVRKTIHPHPTVARGPREMRP